VFILSDKSGLTIIAVLLVVLT